nr:uncharacterized LOC107815048 [Ipomoea batatas]
MTHLKSKLRIMMHYLKIYFLIKNKFRIMTHLKSKLKIVKHHKSKMKICNLHLKKKSRTTWEVDVINGEGFVKKKKLKVKEVWTLPLGEQIIVPFDNFGIPFTEAARLFTGTLAGLAHESSSFPINFTDWRLMPKQYKEDIFTKAIKPKFHFHNDVIAKHWTLQNIGRKWKDFKSRLWIEFYDPSLNRDELISKCPIGIHRDQWSSFVNYRLSEKSKEMCRKNAESRKHQKIAHTCGSKSFAKRRAEMEIEFGHSVNRSELWIDTHKVQRGSSINEECRIITVSML